jgi:death-on-curing protein
LKINYLNHDLVRKIRSRLGLQFDCLQPGQLSYILESVKYVSHNEQTFKRTIAGKAAYLLYEFLNNHLFLDGNKRTAIMVCNEFLELNGFYLDIEQDEALKFLIETAKGNTSKENVREWMKRRIKTRPR